MLTAEDPDGEVVLALDAMAGRAYSCPECGSGLVLKRGRIVSAHFAHQPDRTCQFGVGESLRHMQMKLQLRRMLRDAELEARTSARRADLIVGGRWVCECQESAISIDEVEARTRDYNADGYGVLWVWDLGRVAKGWESVEAVGRCGDAARSEYRIPAEIRWLHKEAFGRVYVLDRAGKLYACHLDSPDFRISDWDEDPGHYPKTLRRLLFCEVGRRLRHTTTAAALRLVGFDEGVFWTPRARRQP